MSIFVTRLYQFVLTKVVNGHIDCLTGEDEMDCESGNNSVITNLNNKKPKICKNHEFPCFNSTVCAVMCDEIDTCGFDERNCGSTIETDGLPCPYQQLKCRDNSKCVPRVWTCDGQEDCRDGSDELGCKPKCQSDTFACDNGLTCLSFRLICDGVKHCLGK